MDDIKQYKIISNYKMLCQIGEGYIFYHLGFLYYQKNLDTVPRRFLKLPMKKWKRAVVNIRLLERFFRLEPRIAVSLNEKNFLLSYQGKIIRINLNGRYEVEHIFRQGMNNPIGFCQFKNRILYGEYFGNVSHEEVCIYERASDGEWSIKYTFRAGEIMHIHQIVYDKRRECFWILTGDSDKESGIWKSDLEFTKVIPVFRGKQLYRSCFLMPSEKGIAFSTDTPLEKNGVYFSEENKEGEWKEPYLVYEMPGPCIYGTIFQEDLYVMATSVEPDASLPSYKYWITNKLGIGIKNRYSYLIIGNMNKGYKVLNSFEKDRYKMWLFQFGNMLFPDLKDKNRIICTGQSIKGLDGKTILIKGY